MGRKIFDPYSVESQQKEIDGLGLLDIETKFQKAKITSRVNAEFNGKRGDIFPFLPLLAQNSLSQELKGYEIHMGMSKGDIGLFKLRRVSEGYSDNPAKCYLDGSQNGNCWGTYIHGIFENDYFRRGIIDYIRQIKGLTPLKFTFNYAQIKDNALENLSDTISDNLDMDFIEGVLKL